MLNEIKKNATGSEPTAFSSAANSKTNFPVSVLSLQEVRAAHHRIRMNLRRPRRERRG